MIIGLFKNLPPRLSVPIFFGITGIALVIRFFVATVYGALVLALILYFYIEQYTNIAPMSYSELLVWLFELPEQYKTSLLTSGVTIFGFVVAFRAATLNWKNQLRAELKVQAAGEIENFFSVVSRNITQMEIHVQSLIDVVNKIQNGTTLEKAHFDISYIQDKGGEYISSRNILSQASIDVHRLIGKYYTLFTTLFGPLGYAQATAKSLQEFNDKMWITLPVVNLDDPNFAQDFINQVRVVDCQQFLNTSRVVFGKINGLSGAIRGQLSAPVWGFNLKMFLNMLGSRKQFMESMEDFHQDLNTKS